MRQARVFAVVAAEVKTLADQTAKATGEIGDQVGGIQAATDDSVSAIKAIGETIAQMSEIATAIASAVEEQNASTQDIATNIQQVAIGTQEVSSSIAGVTGAADVTGQVASQVLEAASELSDQAEVLRGEVGKFLDNVRAA